MPVTASEALAADGVRLRVGPWRGRPDTAEVAAIPAARPVPPDLARSAVERCWARGFDRVVTPALPRSEWRPWTDLGFDVREHLHLLSHHLLDLEPRDPVRLRRVARRDRERVLAVDHVAFDPFWRLDAPALDEAVRATPAARFRMVADGTGYALTGRAGDRGYLQRLAVAPEAQGRGLGRALVLDGLWWLRRWRVREALVNTQVGNDAAVALYRSLGFRARPDGLAVLEVVRPGSPADRAGDRAGGPGAGGPRP